MANDESRIYKYPNYDVPRESGFYWVVADERLGPEIWRWGFDIEEYFGVVVVVARWEAPGVDYWQPDVIRVLAGPLRPPGE